MNEEDNAPRITPIQRIGAMGYRLMNAVLRLTDIRLVALFGRCLGYLVWMASKSRRRIVARNMRIVTDPTLRQDKLSSMVRRNMVRTVMNLACSLKTGIMTDKEAARSILVVGRDEFEKAGIAIDSIVMSGGIPLKNPMLVQVYADILNREIRVCQTTQAGAVGAAILGVAAASSEVTGYHSLTDIAEALGKKGDRVYKPQQDNIDTYNQLYSEYITLYEYFGKGANDVMKRLNKIRQ